MLYRQDSEIKFAKLAEQDPGRARQNSQARAGTNFTKPHTSLISELCTKQSNRSGCAFYPVSIFIRCTLECGFSFHSFTMQYGSYNYVFVRPKKMGIVNDLVHRRLPPGMLYKPSNRSPPLVRSNLARGFAFFRTFSMGREICSF